jgi:hypothetical protein
MKPMRTLQTLLMTLAVAMPVGAAERSDVVRREIALAPGSGRAVEIDNVFGGVEVRAGALDRVTVEIRRTASARRESDLTLAFDEVTLVVEEKAGGVALVQDGPFRCEARGRERRDRRHRWGNCRWDPDYELDWQWTVTVPPDVDLEVRTVNGGAVTIDGVRGDIFAGNVNGALRLTGLAGEVRAATVNGAIAAEYAVVPATDASFQTVNGGIEIALPPGSSADVELETMNGELWSDFAVTVAPRRAEPTATRRRGHRYRLEHDTVVRIGAGGPRFACTTLNGDIVLRER